MNVHERSQKQIVHMNVHKNKKILGTILKDIENSITLKITFESTEIQDVNVFNSIKHNFLKNKLIFIGSVFKTGLNELVYA